MAAVIYTLLNNINPENLGRYTAATGRMNEAYNRHTKKTTTLIRVQIKVIYEVHSEILRCFTAL